MKRMLCALFLASLMVLPASAASFSDVSSGAWYASAVEEVAASGIMTGTSETSFSPDQLVTRGMVAAVLWRLAGSPAPSSSTSFTDVLDWYYYADAVAWAEENGIATGLSGGIFGGGDAVTREQLAVFLYRFCEYRGEQLAAGVLDPYRDAEDIHAWAVDGMAHAVGAGLITGDDTNSLDPGGHATRAQLAVILQRLMTPAVG